MIWDELGELTAKQKLLISVLETIKLEEYLPYIGRVPGRPLEDRTAIARAFVTKMVYNMATTRILLDRLESDPTVRRLCGWERKEDVPSESTFSRAYAEFAESHLPERVHQTLIEQHLGEQIVGHISRDSTAITAREKPEKKTPPVETKPKKRGRPRKGEERPKVLTRLQRQAAEQPLSEMLDALPKACNVGTKRNSKGHTTSWIGYKLRIDTADGGIPVSCLLTSASLHDSQVAMPLAEITNQRVTSLYDMMDSAYDAPQIKAHSRALGHIPIIDPNPRSKIRKAELKAEAKRRRAANYTLAEDRRYNERSTVERVNGRIKDDFGARMVRVQGHAKVMTHLMFGIVVLTVEQLMRVIE
jgi:hypothetical protein